MNFRKLLGSFPSLRANLVMGFGTVARIFSGFAKTKMAALFLGASGVGLIGIGGQLQLLGLTWGSLSISAGFIRSYGLALGSSRRKEVLATSFTLLCGANLLLAVVVIAFRHWLGFQIFGESEPRLVIAALLAVPFQVMIGAYFQGILFAHGHYDDWSRANAAGALVEVVVFAAGIYFWGVAGAFWATGFATFIWAICVFRQCLKVETARNMLSFGWSHAVVRELASSSVATSATSTFAYLAGMLIRMKLLAHFGADMNGAYQAACVISGLYSQLIMNGIWAGLYPLAGKDTEPKELHAAWAESLTVTAGLAVLFQAGILFAPSLVLMIFFSRDFLHAGSFLGWQLLGDFFFLLAQPGLAVLLGSGRFRPYALAWCFFYGLSVVLPLLLFPVLGAVAVTVTYCALSIFLAVYSLGIFVVRRPALPEFFWPLLACFAALALLPAIFYLSAPAYGWSQALLCVVCGSVGVWLFFARASEGVASDRKYSYGEGRKTKILNAGRALILLTGLDSLLARFCALPWVPNWVVKAAPNHYQYPNLCRRSVRREGFSYELDLGDFLDWHIYYGKMEGAKNQLYRLAARGDAVIDVGANIGETSLHLARRVGSGGRVVAFEPDPRMREKCRRNVELNGAANVHLEPYALSDESRKYLLHRVSERNPAGNRILTEPALDFPSVEVEALRLDEYVGRTGLEGVKLVKIDVEGFEEKVLRGGEAFILRQRPRLFVELSEANLRAQGSSSQALLNLFHEWNYEVTEASTGRALTPDCISPGLHCDVICVPKPEISSSKLFT
ncbi:MAG: FkbM family methyltransferase [Bacteriovoracia bacterium]